jgi:hypothetical protein
LKVQQCFKILSGRYIRNEFITIDEMEAKKEIMRQVERKAM